NEALLARAWVLPVARLYGPQGYLFQQNQSVCGPTSIADVMRSEGFAADTAAMLSRSDSLQIFGFLPFGLTLDEEARLLERDNGEYTSFPKPNVCNALPTKEEVFALSEIASAANGRTIVDLPSGVGFCLFITRECLDSVGYLSEAYSRGYLEDVD